MFSRYCHDRRSTNHAHNRRNTLSCLSLHTREPTVATARSSSCRGTRVAIQHSSVEVLEICVLAPLEKLLLQVSTASAVSGTCTNCTFSLGHLLRP